MIRSPISIVLNSSGSEPLIIKDSLLPSNQPGMVLAGSDGSRARLLKTSVDGSVFITGSLTLSQGTQIVSGTVNLDRGNTISTPLFISGSVGLTALSDAAGRIIVAGSSASGSAQSSDPILIAGIDASGSVRLPLIDYDGTTFIKHREEATFVYAATGVAIGNNKSMISLLNASSAKVIRIQEIWIRNVQTSTVTGVVSTFEIRRVTGHSAGTLVTAEKMDSADMLDSGVTLRTGATVSGESATLLWRVLFSSDEWVPNTADAETQERVFQNAFPVYVRRDLSLKPITLWPGQGISVKHIVNSTAGTFDLFVVLTQVP